MGSQRDTIERLNTQHIELEGGAAAWLVGTLVVPSVQGHGLPQLQELSPYQNFL